MKILRALGYGLLTLIALVVLLLIAARFNDGPIAIVPGGDFTSGDIVNATTEPDWQFVRDMETVELQTLEPVRSRTTWIIEHQGKIYIPCGYMNTAWGKVWKKWPVEAEKDGRAVLRVDGKRYSRYLTRVKSGAALDGVVRSLSEKYKVPATLEAVDNNSLWIFELQAPR